MVRTQVTNFGGTVGSFQSRAELTVLQIHSEQSEIGGSINKSLTSVGITELNLSLLVISYKNWLSTIPVNTNGTYLRHISSLAVSRTGVSIARASSLRRARRRRLQAPE